MMLSCQDPAAPLWHRLFNMWYPLSEWSVEQDRYSVTTNQRDRLCITTPGTNHQRLVAKSSVLRNVDCRNRSVSGKTCFEKGRLILTHSLHSSGQVCCGKSCPVNKLYLNVLISIKKDLHTVNMDKSSLNSLTGGIGSIGNSSGIMGVRKQEYGLHVLDLSN